MKLSICQPAIKVFPLMIAMASASLTSSKAVAANLFDAIALAYQTSPALLAARADQRALDETFIQARDALGPTASVSGQHALDYASVDQPASFFSPALRTNERAINDSGQLVINQPLYAQGQLSAAISVARANVLGGRQTLRQQEASIINQIVTAYADVLLAQYLVTIAEDNIGTLRGQVTETEARVDAKQLTLTDGAQARARLIAAEVQLTQARRSLVDAQAKYLASVGEPAGQLDPLPDLPGIPPNLGAALNAADRANPQLLAATYTELASRAAVAEAKATDGLQIGFSTTLSQQPVEPYLPRQYSRSITAALVISRPLFKSGDHSSHVRQAIEINNRDDLKLADARRQIVSVVIQAWGDLAAQRRQLVGLHDQLIEETKAFQGAQTEEHFGLRTTIDLLNAEQELQSIKVAVAQGFHDEYLSQIALLAGIGVLQAELLDPKIEPYKPEISLTNRDFMARLLPWEALVSALDTLGAPHVNAELSDRDALGRQGSGFTIPMPEAPQWSELIRDAH